MELKGDPDAIAALKALKESNRDYLKFLLKEAQSNTDRLVTYKGPDGVNYKLEIEFSGDLKLSKG
jgi:hypothetical protein